MAANVCRSESTNCPDTAPVAPASSHAWRVSAASHSFLDPLLHSVFDKYAPERGVLTKQSDRGVVLRLTAEALENVKNPRTTAAIGSSGAPTSR